jgi:predicted nucleic acid-binding Zn ribbon protein
VSKSDKTQSREKAKSSYETRRTRNARILFAILCVIIILSMVLSLTVNY